MLSFYLDEIKSQLLQNRVFRERKKNQNHKIPTYAAKEGPQPPSQVL